MSYMTKGMERAIFASKSSHDPDTQTGCAVYDRSGVFITAGANRIPFPITITEERRTRPKKYNWIEHAERTAIFGHGSITDFFTATMFLNWFPCADCARALVGVGISKLVYKIKADRLSDPKYGFEDAKAILQAGGVILIDYDEYVMREAALHGGV